MVRVRWGYVLRQTGVGLLSIYLILLAGSITGLVNFRLKAFNLFLGLLFIGGWLVAGVVRKHRIQASGLELGFALFLGGQLVATVFSQDWRRSAMILVIFAVYLLVFYQVLTWLRSGWSLDTFGKAFLIAGILIVFFGLRSIWGSYFGWRTLMAGLPYAPEFKRRLFVVFGDANVLAAVVNLFIPLAVVYLFSKRDIFAKALGGSYLLGSVVVVYFADSRGGLLGLASSLGVLLLGWVFFASPAARQQFDRLVEWLRASPIVTAVLLLLVIIGVGVVANRFLSFEGDATHGSVQSARSVFWGAAIETFAESRLVGNGPGTFPTELIEYTSVPPTRPYLHAHSLFFNVLAESGLLGIFGLLGLVVVVVWRAWGQIKAGTVQQRAVWVAFAAALVGANVHMLVDHFVYYFSVGGVLAIYLAAMMYLGEGKEEEADRRSFQMGWLVLIGVLVLGMSLFSLRAHAVHERALDKAAAQDWQGAAEDFRLATELDQDNALYWLNLGYAEGVLAVQDDTGALQNAIVAYQQGLALEPSYSINYMNLGALYWENGQREESLTYFERAVEMAPDSALLWDSFGLYLSEAGQAAAGQVAFAQAEALRAPDEIAELLLAADAALTIGNLNEAEALLQEAWSVANQNDSVYDGFAHLAVARGDLDLAQRYVQAGLWVQSQHNDEKIFLLITLAEISLLEGDEATALDTFTSAYQAITETTSFGWGAKGWVPYGSFVFQRRTLRLDLLPQLRRLEMTPDVAVRFLPLVELSEQTGLSGQAALVEQTIERIMGHKTAP